MLSLILVSERVHYCSVAYDSHPLQLTDTINLLLLFAQGEGAESKQTALKIMREMLYLGLGMCPLCMLVDQFMCLCIITVEPSLTTFLRLLDCFMKQSGWNESVNIL